MPDELESLMMKQVPTADRPLLGLTVLVVEDSLYACEAMRLLCLRSGARIRRADSLKSAHRHLSVYRPVVVIVDLGLPDGSGAELINELAIQAPRVAVILGISGETDGEEVAIAAGADGFLEKPITSLAAFQAAVLAHLPRDNHPSGPHCVSSENVTPDPLALHEDLTHISQILNASINDSETMAYVAQFLTGIARLAQDVPLELAANKLKTNCRSGHPINSDVANIAGLVQERLRSPKAV